MFLSDELFFQNLFSTMKMCPLSKHTDWFKLKDFNTNCMQNYAVFIATFIWISNETNVIASKKNFIQLKSGRPRSSKQFNFVLNAREKSFTKEIEFLLLSYHCTTDTTTFILIETWFCVFTAHITVQWLQWLTSLKYCNWIPTFLPEKWYDTSLFVMFYQLR